MDKLGGFISIFSSPGNETNYQGTSAEIEPLESNFQDEDLEDEDLAGLENQQQQQPSESKSFTFSTSSLGMPSMTKNPSSMMSSFGSIRSSNFFGLRQQQQQQQQEPTEVNEEVTSPVKDGEINLVDQDIEAQNVANENSGRVATAETAEEQPPPPPPSSNRSKLHWKSFAGLARAKLQLMRPYNAETKNSAQEQIPLAEDAGTNSGQSDFEESFKTTGGECSQETENLISKFGGENCPLQTEKGHDECWQEVFKDKGRLELVTMDGGGSCFVCKARLSYDPMVECSGEMTASDELAFKTGDVVLVWLPLDENGFFQAELLTGKKGLVHSDMIPQIAGKSTE